MSKPIEDYALLGDGETAALVSRDGSIDWLCWPRFDDDACFAALLGTAENGHWSMAPIASMIRQSRRYQQDTLVMETDFETGDGAVRVLDFMPMRRTFIAARCELYLGSTSQCRLSAKRGPGEIGCCAPSPARVGIMYRVDGARHLAEWTVDAVPGYRYSQPVRVGNAASTQRQIDVFGEVLDCLDLARRGGVPTSEQEAAVALKIVEHLAAMWDSEGSGVWESRAEPRHYTYSKVMAWVAFDRFIRHHEASGTVSTVN